MIPRYIKFQSSSDVRKYEQSGIEIPPLGILREQAIALLGGAQAEAPIQNFFELHPHFLPGISARHNGPYADLVVTKLPLGHDFKTDFAFVACNSQELQMTLIEIEAPQKKLFRKDGSFTRDYYNARQQLSDWLFWASKHRRAAMDVFGPLLSRVAVKSYDLSFQAYLVCGRRSQIESQTAQERWAAEAQLTRSGLCTMTYDRLIERIQWELTWPLTKKVLVCTYAGRCFQVKYVTI